MNNDKMTDVLQALKQPFHPTQVTWKPGVTTKDGSKALALAYADLRAYQNRLDDICGLAWSVTYTPWGERIVCHLTIQGITRSSSGEPDSQAERSEIAGTSAEAQAFKRACAMFGLGRYLYNLPSVWVEYDATTKQFTEKAKAKLEGIIVQHYRRTMMAETDMPIQRLGESLAEPGAQGLRSLAASHLPTLLSAVDAATEPSASTTDAAQLTAEQPTIATVDNAVPHLMKTENDAKPQISKASATVSGAPAPMKSGNGSQVTLDPLRQQFNRLGQELYGDQWTQVSRHNVERITGGKAVDSGALTTEQIQKLVDGMKKLQRKRHTALPIYESATDLGRAVAA